MLELNQRLFVCFAQTPKLYRISDFISWAVLWSNKLTYLLYLFMCTCFV